MGIQNLKIGNRDTVYIATPLGMIELSRPGGRHGKGFAISLPDQMYAFKDRDRAIEASPFITEANGGSIAPAYTFLVPKIDANTGELVGVKNGTDKEPLLLGLPKGDMTDGQADTEIVERVESSGGGGGGGHLFDEPVCIDIPVG